ncbi:MAG: FG-GAP repeat protein [Deltaproteobacteria bacterium]|nr:FG-GAP repeat protein [Deltaproteobacteria bacterium]
MRSLSLVGPLALGFAVVLGCGVFGCGVDVEKSDAGPGPIPGSITGEGADHSDNFGSAVAIDGDTVAVGAAGADFDDGSGNTAPRAGAVIVYSRTGVAFSEAARLTRPEGTPEWEDAFGTAIALAGDLLVVGAPGVDRDPDPDDPDIIQYSNAGAAYVFQGAGATWTHIATLTSPSPFLDQRFGSSVALADDLLIVGAAGVDRDARDVGAVVVYSRAGSEFTVATAAAASLR